MERPVLKPIGTPAEQLDTPALVVDVDALKANLIKVQFDNPRMDRFRIHPRLDAHLCPEIASWQAGYGAHEFAVSTISQAEAFVSRMDFEHDKSLCILNTATSRADADRVAHIAKTVQMISIGAETAAAVDALAAARAAAGRSVYVGVAIPIRADSRSIGVSPQDAAALAERVNEADGLWFGGVFSAPPLTLGDRDADPSPAPAALSEAAARCAEKTGSRCLSYARGSALYDEARLDDYKITDLIAGSYALGDRRLIERCPEIRPAARILATVMSEQDPGLAWLDAGQKATSIDTGLPLVDGIPGASITRMSAEHGCMELAEGASWDIRLGDKVWLIPHDIANTVNVYDYVHAVEDGKLVDIWRTAGRGGY